MIKTTIQLLLITIALATGIRASNAQSQPPSTDTGDELFRVDRFEKIIISPHIEATLEKGKEEGVVILDQKIPREKIHIAVKNKTLRIYLDDAKITTKHIKRRKNGVRQSIPVYRGKQLTVRIIYKSLNGLEIRGEENVVSKGLLKAGDFILKMYGEASLLAEDLEIAELNARFYGENNFKCTSGVINTQNFKAYGDCLIDVRNAAGSFIRISSYGESEFYVHAEDKINVLAFGETKVRYKGQPEIEKTVSIGDTDIAAIDP